jgi:DNA-binding protein HU-beta
MNRKEFVDALAIKAGTSKADTDRTVGALLEVISEALAQGESISLTGFGTFCHFQKAIARIIKSRPHGFF